jgi:hypothetical protein
MEAAALQHGGDDANPVDARVRARAALKVNAGLLCLFDGHEGRRTRRAESV